MKRPFALLGFTAFAAVTFAGYYGPKTALTPALICAVLAFCAILAAVRIFWKQKLLSHIRSGAFSFSPAVRGLLTAGAALLTIAVSLLLYCRAYETRVAPAAAFCGRRLRIRGVVLDYPEEAWHRSYYRMRVEQAAVDGKEIETPQFVLRFSASQNFFCRPYDTLECTVQTFGVENTDTLYSSVNSLWAGGVALSGYLADYQEVSVIPYTDWPPGRILAELRQSVGRSFEKRLPGSEAALIRAMLLGERDAMPASAYSRFREIGAAHLLVVSGLHLAAIAGMASFLFRRMPGRRLLRNLLTGGVVLLFICLAGFSAPVLRAGIMLLLALLADSLGREPDGVNSLGFAVLVLCLWNPFYGGSLSFSLSVFSTLGVVTLSQPISGWILSLAGDRPLLKKLLNPVSASLGLTFGSMLASLPVQLLAFGRVSLIAPLANLILVFPCTALLYLSFFTAFFGLLPLRGLMAPLVFCTGWLARFALYAAEHLSRLSVTGVSFSEPTDFLALAVLSCLILALRFLGKSHPAACAALSAAVVLCGYSLWLSLPGALDTVTLAVPADSSAVLLMQGRRAVVLSLGGYRTFAAEEMLVWNDIRSLEALCLPVRDGDAREAAEVLLNRYPTDRLVLPVGARPGRSLIDAAENAESLYLEEGESFSVLKDIAVTARYGMGRLELIANGVSVTVETADTGGGSCQVLITTQTCSRINSPFTVWQSDDIIENSTDLRDVSSPGIIPGGDGLYIDLLPDGTVSLRGESQCLSLTPTN